MELKPVSAGVYTNNAILLIVPYGIETEDQHVYLKNLIYLLIVPYGIETGLPISIS